MHFRQNRCWQFLRTTGSIKMFSHNLHKQYCKCGFFVGIIFAFLKKLTVSVSVLGSAIGSRKRFFGPAKCSVFRWSSTRMLSLFRWPSYFIGGLCDTAGMTVYVTVGAPFPDGDCWDCQSCFVISHR